MGVGSGCGEQDTGVASGSGWNLWVWLLGVVVRRYIDFLIHVLLIPTPLVSVLLYLFSFAAASLLFVHFKNVFRSCSSIYFFVIIFYVLNNFFAQYRHTYVPWPIGAMPLRVSDFHFPISVFHSLAQALALTLALALARS